jgi:hypothetical protein
VAALVRVAAVAPFEQAARLVGELTGLTISPRHLQTLAHEVGAELAAARDERTRQLLDRPAATPPAAASPPLATAAVMVDGGRVQAREPGRGPGVHAPRWRESKAAVLLRMTDAASGLDPHPDLPRCFAAPVHAASPAAHADADADADATPTWGPRTLFRTGLASLACSDDFGPMLAAEAERRGFHSATRGAFLGDGQAYNWSIQRRFFARFTPILDFVHAAEHLHEAAAAAGDPALGRAWAEACWRGRVDAVLDAVLAARAARTPPADPDAEPDHPWNVLGRAATYLANNRDRMDYPRYRREGLPTTSSPVESWIRRINQRVKGSDKFWEDGPRAEAILQLRCAWLGDDDALTRHLAGRPGHPHSRPRTLAPRAA